MKARNRPELFREDAVKALWCAVLKQAVEDLDGGGIVAESDESSNVKLERQLEAFHFIMTDRSRLAFRIQGVDPDSLRDVVRKLVRSGEIDFDINRQFQKFTRKRKPKPEHEVTVLEPKNTNIQFLVPAA